MRMAQTDLIAWCSLLLVLSLGLPVALVLAMSRSGGPDAGLPAADLVALHGTVQLWGFAVLFIVGMALRLMGIFHRGPAPSPWLTRVVTGLIIAALGSRTVAYLSGGEDALQEVRIASSLLLLGSAAAFLAIVVAVLRSPRLRSSRTVISFVVGAILLTLAGLLEVFSALREDSNFYGTAAISLAVLGGFAVAFIAGIASRSLQKSPWLEGPFMAVFGVAVSLTCVMLTYVGQTDASDFAVRATNGLLCCVGILWITIVGIVGVFSPAANRPGVASKPHLLLLRSAFLWLIVTGGILSFTGAEGAVRSELPSAGVVDAVRHALGIGVVTNLMLGMGLLLLPGFASEHLARPLQRTMAVALLVLRPG